MKKSLSLLIALMMLLAVKPVFNGTASTEFISVGDEIILGMYNGSPIKWICVLIDGNGPLMLAKEVICKKEYDAAGYNLNYHSDGWGYIRKERGSNCWEDSNIRQWLNTSGTVNYSHCPPSYNDEDGFMSNFSEKELACVKKVAHKVTMVKYDSTRQGYCDGGFSDTFSYGNSFDIDNCYHKLLEDYFMLLDASQVNELKSNNSPYLNCNDSYFTAAISGNNFACFELVTPIDGGSNWACNKNGIRPAFYFNDDGNVNNSDSFEQTEETFSEKKYIADIWLNRAGKDFESAESYLLNNTFLYPGFESMSSVMTESLKNNDVFNGAVAAWNVMSVFFTPEDFTKTFVLKKQDLYDSVVIDMISYVLNDELFLANLESRALEVSKTVNDVLSVPVKIADTVYEIEDVPILKELKKTDPETWSKYTKLQYENLTKSGVNIGTLSDCSSALGFLLEYAENGLDFIKSVSAYQMVGELEASLQNALYAIKSKSSSLLLRASIEKITYLSIEDKAELSYSVAASEFTVNMVETIASEIASAALSAYPIYGQLKAVYEVGSTFCNLVLSTQNIIDKAQLIAAASELYSSAKASAVDLKNKYIASDSYNDAASFIASVELLMSASVIDMNCALDFVKAATEDGLINKANKIPNAVMSLFGKGEATTYEQLCQSVENITSIYSQNIDFMKTNWIMDSNYLRADYPDVFPVYARDEITNLKYAPEITDLYVDNSGETNLSYKVLWENNGVRVNEFVDGGLTTYDFDSGDEYNYYDSIVFCNESKITIFPKSYTLESYVNSTEGKIYSSESSQKTLENPLKKPYIDIMLNPDNLSQTNKVNSVFVIKDTTSDYYENITYSIYRKTPNSDYAKIDEIKRGENLINGYTTYRDETVESGMIYTYMISSVLTLDNGITINADGEKTFTVKTSDLPGDRFDITVEFVNNGRRSVATRAAAALTRSSTPEDNSGIFLKWQSDTEADSYEIYRKPAFSEEYKLIGTAGSECEYFDTSAADGLSYDYIIAAYMTDNGEQIYLGSSNSVSYTNYRLLLSGESTVEQGKTVQLSVETSPVSDEAITWTVDNSGVASVDENGVVTGLSQGTATVTATTFNGISETYKITVINSENLEEPTTAPEEPTTAPEEPTTAPEEPTTVPEEPTTVPEEPTTAPEEPTTEPEEPTTAPEEPTTKPNETTTEKPTEPKPEYTLGDIDGNGKITAADARLALRISAKLETGTENQLLAADTDKNGRITASDARKILRVAANLDRF